MKHYDITVPRNNGKTAMRRYVPESSIVCCVMSKLEYADEDLILEKTEVVPPSVESVTLNGRFSCE